MDTDQVGSISQEDIDSERERTIEFFRRIDTDDDDKISIKQLENLGRLLSSLDTDHDG